jgi:hypothetical protein
MRRDAIVDPRVILGTGIVLYQVCSFSYGKNIPSGGAFRE